MISPEQQAYDWQTGSIQLVDSLTDARNVTKILFVLTLIALSYRIVVNIWTQINSNHTSPSPPSMTTMEQCKEMKPNVYSSSHAMFVSILFIILPYLPASNLFLTVGFVVAERLLYIPRFVLKQKKIINVCTYNAPLQHWFPMLNLCWY